MRKGTGPVKEAPHPSPLTDLGSQPWEVKGVEDMVYLRSLIAFT
ncbi:hypothetical protein [Stygiolobus caldivivus]|nr:hypothetical protein [Stygiolobus caldivivus]